MFMTKHRDLWIKEFFHWSPIRQKPFDSMLRMTFLIICTTVGGYLGRTLSEAGWMETILGTIIGLAAGVLALGLENGISLMSRSALLGWTLGLSIGLLGTILLISAWQIDLFGISSLGLGGLSAFLVFSLYVGWTLGSRLSQVEHNLSPQHSTDPAPASQTQDRPGFISKVLDSSAIIDGRVVHLCSTGFLEGPLLLPNCVLGELHTLADSDSTIKRTKGKRGLEILSELQQLSNHEITVIEDQDPRISTVDHQLIAIAKHRGGTILTNDWNLAKIADVQGVSTLNVNELTYHLRPLVLPGEIINVFIQKDGQGPGQGIAHLDDGTMVVIDHGASFVGQTIPVEVTRYMQTSTGRMIFASPSAQAPNSPQTPPLLSKTFSSPLRS